MQANNVHKLTALEYALLTDLLSDLGCNLRSIPDTFCPDLELSRKGLRRVSNGRRTVKDTIALRSACLKTGLSYYANNRIVGSMACQQF